MKMLTMIRYILAPLAVLGLSAGLALLRERATLDLSPSAPLLLLLAVFLAALWAGLGAALLAAVVAGLCYDYFFLLPYYTFTIGRYEDVIAFAVFFVVAIVASRLAAQADGRARDAEARLHETSALNSLSAALLDGGSLSDEVARQVASTVGAMAVSLYVGDGVGQAMRRTAYYGDTPEQTAEQEEAEAQRSRELVVEGTTAYVPLRAAGGALGLIIVRRAADASFSPTDRRLLDTIGTLLAGSLERQRLGQEANEVLVLREADAVKSSLLAAVSHELRTPLAGIMGSATSLLSDEANLDPTARRELLETIAQGSERLSRLVNNLLNLSRVEAGALHLERGLYSPAELINAVATAITPRLAAHKLVLDLPADLPLVPMDYLLIQQVLINLLDNAAAYTPSGTAITIAATLESEDLLISVEDEGMGLPQEDLELIFDRFYRGSTSLRNASGVGIGLTLARGFVEAHSGRIWAVNRRKGGLRVTFSLPLHPADLPQFAESEGE